MVSPWVTAFIPIAAIAGPEATAAQVEAIRAILDNPDRLVPKVHQVTIGYERQLAQQMAATVDYIHSWNRDQLINFDLNPGFRINTSRTGSINYTDLENIAGRLGIAPFTNPVVTRLNDGSSQFDGVNFMLEKRYSNRKLYDTSESRYVTLDEISILSVYSAMAVYAIAFIGGFAVPTKLGGPPATDWPTALAIDIALLGAGRAIQQSRARQIPRSERRLDQTRPSG